MLTVEDLSEFKEAGCVLRDVQVNELIRVYRMYLEAEAEGRVLPRLPNGFYIKTLGQLVINYQNILKSHAGHFSSTLSKVGMRHVSYRGRGPTPADAVANAIKMIEQ